VPQRAPDLNMVAAQRPLFKSQRLPVARQRRRQRAFGLQYQPEIAERRRDRRVVRAKRLLRQDQRPLPWCTDQEHGRNDPTPSGVRRCGRNSGVPAPACG
jgi:hypothetical protein